MKTILAALCMMACSAWFVPATALASPGGTPGGAYDDQRIEVLDSATVPCPQRGAMCLRAGDSSTQSVASSAAATLAGHPGGNDAPRFTRSVTRVGRNNVAFTDDSVPWTIELDTTLRRQAMAGNAMFALYDTEDPKALAAREVTALWQAPIRAGNQIAARLVLSPDDGFRPNHTYRIRIMQLVGGKEILLAEGDVRLQ